MRWILLILLISKVVLSQAQGINSWLGDGGLTRYNIGSSGLENPVDAPSIPDYTTNLVYSWSGDSTFTTDVKWTNTLDTFALRQSTAGNKPTQSSDIILFDGGDYIWNGTTLNFGSNAFSVHLIIKVVDTAHTSPPLSHEYFHLKNSTRILEWFIFHVGAGNRFQVLLYNGTNWNNTRYYPLSAIKLNKYTLYSITYDGTNTIKFYTNGVLQSGTTTASSGFTNEGFWVGGLTRFVPNGTGYKNIRVYKEETSQDNITTLYNYYNSLGKIDP